MTRGVLPLLLLLALGGIARDLGQGTTHGGCDGRVLVVDEPVLIVDGRVTQSGSPSSAIGTGPAAPRMVASRTRSAGPRSA